MLMSRRETRNITGIRGTGVVDANAVWRVFECFALAGIVFSCRQVGRQVAGLQQQVDAGNDLAHARG